MYWKNLIVAFLFPSRKGDFLLYSSENWAPSSFFSFLYLKYSRTPNLANSIIVIKVIISIVLIYQPKNCANNL